MEKWQTHLGFWGSLLWLGSFPLGKFVHAYGNEQIAQAIYGYTIGYVTVFAGYLFWDHVVKGRWSELIGDGWPSRTISGVCLGLILIMGLAGVCSSIFGTNPWYYSLLFALGGLVVNQGLKPIIDYLEGSRTSNKKVQG